MTRMTAARGWGRGLMHGIAGVALASGLVFGPAATAHADVLDDLSEQYNVGSGGGQLSNLLKVSLKLRAMGFKPSKANLEAVATAMNYRPNQNPLISALKDTIAYQSKLMAQMEILQSAQAGQNANSAVMGAGQMPGASNPNQLGTGPATISVVPTAPATVPAAPATVPAAPATP